MQQKINTPKPLKALLLVTAGINLITALSSGLSPSFSLHYYLGLSLNGIQNFYLWQLITYLFTQPDIGISFASLFKIAFNIYILWFAAKSYIFKKGFGHFFSVYFLSGFFSAVIAILLMPFSQTSLLTGNLTAIYGLLVCWITVSPRTNVILFFALPLKAANLVYAFLGINLFLDLASGNWLYAVSYGSAAIFGFFYGHLFPEKRSNKQTYTKAKIFDFKTGQAILNDDEFLEEMLSKISIHGKNSLTWREKWRLRLINKRRKKGTRHK